MKQHFNIFTLFFVIALFSSPSFSQWVNIPSGTTRTLNSVEFADINVGWVTGDSGLVRKTMNGGGIWTTQTTNTNRALRNIYVLSTNNVIVSGDIGIILRTTNGGTNWSIVSPLVLMGDPPNYYDIDFLNSNTGITIGQTRYFARTVNGGASWITGQLNTAGQTNINYSAVDLIDTSNAFIASSDFQLSGQWNSYIQKSTNNGSSYGIVKTVNSSVRCAFTDIEFISINTGFASNQNGKLYRTSNGGTTWDSASLGFTPISIEFVNSNTGYICGLAGNLSKTTDGGFTWLLQTSPVNTNLNANFFNDPMTGYAVGNNGTIVKTVNGGSYVGITQVGTGIPEEFGLHQNYPNPFNPVTNLRFEIPDLRFVKLIIYDVLGGEVQTLVNEKLQAGTYKAVWNASNFPSGIYFYRLTAGDFVQTRKMILIK